jgi:hypothetical protein
VHHFCGIDRRARCPADKPCLVRLEAAVDDQLFAKRSWRGCRSRRRRWSRRWSRCRSRRWIFGNQRQVDFGYGSGRGSRRRWRTRRCDSGSRRCERVSLRWRRRRSRSIGRRWRGRIGRSGSGSRRRRCRSMGRRWRGRIGQSGSGSRRRRCDRRCKRTGSRWRRRIGGGRGGRRRRSGSRWRRGRLCFCRVKAPLIHRRADGVGQRYLITKGQQPETCDQHADDGGCADDPTSLHSPFSIFHLPTSNFQRPTSNFRLPTSIAARWRYSGGCHLPEQGLSAESGPTACPARRGGENSAWPWPAGSAQERWPAFPPAGE